MFSAMIATQCVDRMCKCKNILVYIATMCLKIHMLITQYEAFSLELNVFESWYANVT